jgi:hypothetical protein
MIQDGRNAIGEKLQLAYIQMQHMKILNYFHFINDLFFKNNEFFLTVFPKESEADSYEACITLTCRMIQNVECLLRYLQNVGMLLHSLSIVSDISRNVILYCG